MIYYQFLMLIIAYSLDMFRASLCPTSGEKTTCYCIWGTFAVTREDAVLSVLGIVCDLISCGYWCVCVCVAVSRLVCRGIVSQFVRLVGSGAWGLVHRCMYQPGWGFFTCRYTG